MDLVSVPPGSSGVDPVDPPTGEPIVIVGPGTDPVAVVEPIRPLLGIENAVEPLDGTRARPGLARVARLLVVLADGVAVAGAMIVAYAMLPSLYLDADSVASAAYQRVGVLSLPLWLAVFRHYRLYNARHVTERRDEVGRVVHAVGMSALLTALVAYFLDQPVERSWYLMLFGVGVVAMLLERELVRFGFSVLRRRGHCLRSVAIAGTGAEALAMARTFSEKPQLGYAVVGLVGERDQVVPELADKYPVFDPRSKMVEELRAAGATGVVVATTDVDAETSNRLIRRLTDAGIHVEMSSSLLDIDATRLSVRPLGGFAMLYVEPVKRDGWRPVAKRAFDLVLSSVVLILTLPVLLVAAVAIKLTSPGPVLYRQERVGYRGRRFRMLKFRSMYVNSDSLLQQIADRVPAGPVVKIRRDPRVTPVGRILRRLSIDELPQLINVVRGDMSLVGPRPEQPSEVALWTPQLFDRLRVRPGVTGVWQVNGRSAARNTKDRWDLYYVDNWSVWRDLTILAKTVPAVISSKGAY
ncbi:MAG: sugar transferase [Actinomycetota bacterium]|nr:sugar transferase [Actinomycetota bacterium]